MCLLFFEAKMSSVRQLFKLFRVPKTNGYRKGSSHHGPPRTPEPYEVPHHATYPSEAKLWANKPEGWEWVTLVTYVASTVAVIGGLQSKELESFKVNIASLNGTLSNCN